MEILIFTKIISIYVINLEMIYAKNLSECRVEIVRKILKHELGIVLQFFFHSIFGLEMIC